MSGMSLCLASAKQSQRSQYPQLSKLILGVAAISQNLAQEAMSFPGYGFLYFKKMLPLELLDFVPEVQKCG